MPDSNNSPVEQHPACALCDSTDQLGTRFVSCGLETTWKTRENNQDKELTTQDDIRVWELALCGDCLGRQRAKHLKNESRSALILLALAAGAVLLGLLAYLGAEYRWRPGATGTTGQIEQLIFALLYTAGLGCGAVGLVLLPGSAWMAIRATREHNAHASGKSLSDAGVDSAFAEAGRTLLEKKNSRRREAITKTPGASLPFAKLEPYEKHPDAADNSRAYRRGKENIEVLQAARHPDETVPGSWARRYLELNRAQDREKLAGACDRDTYKAGTWFLYFAVLVAVLLVASARSWLNGSETAAFLLVVPAVFFPGLGALWAWIYSGLQVKEFGRLFNRLWSSGCMKRFVARNVVGIIAITTAAVYLVHSHATYVAANPLKLYHRMDVTFGCPRDWYKRKDNEIERLQRSHEGRIIGAFDPARDALFLVTLEQTSGSPEKAFAARRKQIEASKANGDVTRVHRLELTEVNGHPAIYVDIERPEAGRSRVVALYVRKRWVGVSLVLMKGPMEEYDATFDAILWTID